MKLSTFVIAVNADSHADSKSWTSSCMQFDITLKKIIMNCVMKKLMEYPIRKYVMHTYEKYLVPEID